MRRGKASAPVAVKPGEGEAAACDWTTAAANLVVHPHEKSSSHYDSYNGGRLLGDARFSQASQRFAHHDSFVKE
jgi:hypothetical protein